MKKFWKRTWAFVADNWLPGLVGMFLLSFVIVALTFKLSSLVGGASESEALISSFNLAPEFIARNPLFLPYSCMLWVTQILNMDNLAALRGISVLFGLLGLFGFYYLLKKWYSPRMALIGAAIFASSSWFLHTSRFASPDSVYLLTPLLIAGVAALQAKARSPFVLLAVLLLGLSMLYVPGLVWFLVPAVIMQRRVISNSIGLQPTWLKIVLGVAGAALLAPLIIMIARPIPGLSASDNCLAIIGLPNNLSALGDVFPNAMHTLSDIFVYSTAGPIYTAGHLPWLDACSGILAIIGIIQFSRHFRLDRTKLLGIVGIVGLTLIAFGGPVPIVLLLPFVYLLSVEGLKSLLDMWLGVFPRNPFARGFGVTLAVLLVCMVGTYQVQKYFLAWAHAPETRAVFNKEV